MAAPPFLAVARGRMPLVQLATIAACAGGGALFALLGTPLPWMLGSLLTMAALRLGPRVGAATRWGRPVGQWLVGTALGLQFTPVVLRAVADVGGWLLLTAASAPLLGLAGSALLVRLTGVDRGTAWFASVPGGAMEMSVLAERAGARVDRVAVAQSLRIVMVVLTLPPLFALLGLHGSDPWHVTRAVLAPPLLAALLPAMAVLGWIASRAGLPNAWVLAPLAGAALIAGGGWLDGRLPVALIDVAQVLIGCALGARFDRALLTGAPRYVAAVGATVALALALSALLAAAVAWQSGLGVPTLVLAGAPGGITEMALTARTLDLGVPVVVAAHVLRIALVVTTAGLVHRWLLRPA